uniref:Putative secreted protein n=1 Tax=Anopheles darlingi TaxID=43151 RepID=A0A2M4DI65_ANODA
MKHLAPRHRAFALLLIALDLIAFVDGQHARVIMKMRGKKNAVHVSCLRFLPFFEIVGQQTLTRCSCLAWLLISLTSSIFSMESWVEVYGVHIGPGSCMSSR